MTATILDGKKLAATVRAEVREGVVSFTREHGRAPGLEVILVGEDPASQIYTRNKEKAAEEVGIRGKLHVLPAETTEAELINTVFPHPTVSETMHEAVLDAYGRGIHF